MNIEYRIVDAKVHDHYLGSFADAVNYHIAEGWTPLGGPAFDHHNQRLFQAMTREVPEVAA